MQRGCEPSFYVSRILYSFEGFDKKYKDFFANDLDRYTEWKQNVELCDAHNA